MELPDVAFASDEAVKAWLEGNPAGYGDGYGDGNGNGNGNGSGSGSGYGDGYGYGNGNGNGSGSGSGYGDGSGSGDISRYTGHKVHSIDGVLTIIRSVHGMFAKAYVIRGDLQVVESYIAKGEGFFAHGDTMKAAAAALREKILEEKSEEERIAEFVAEFPSLECAAKGETFYSWHHILTGSCKQGRDLFCSEKGLSLDATYTVSEFIKLTESAYGSEIIRKLKRHYDGKN